MKNRSKVLSTTHLILALLLLFTSLHFLTSAITYDRQQSFAPPTLRYDAESNKYLVMNMKTPLLILFTVLFGLGWWCVSLSESFLLRNSQKMAYTVFFIPSVIIILSFIGMTQFPLGFVNSALTACGYIVISGFYLRYSMISPEALVKSSKRN